MKYVYIFLIFVIGAAMGRWSVPETEKEPSLSEVVAQTGSNPNITPGTHQVKTEKNSIPVEGNISSIEPELADDNKKLVRTDSKARDKHIRYLFALLYEANEKGNAEEQNRLFAEIEKLDPKHEKVFEAKAMFLQDDENWDGAHEVLKECVTAIPDSLFCLRRLGNIRSSTTEDKIHYGTQCLQIAANDPFCLVDVAIALHSKGEFTKAKDYFELALSLPMKGEGYHKEYILFQYAQALENLSMYQKAKEALQQACRLKMKSACEKLKS